MTMCLNNSKVVGLDGGVTTASRTNRAVSVVLVDDHPMTRMGARQAVDAQPGLELLGEAVDPGDALTLIESLKPDVAVVDLVYADSTGFDLIKDLKVRVPGCRVVVYTAMESRGYAEQCQRGGASGYVAKSEPIEYLLRAIRLVGEGGIYLSESRAGTLLSKLALEKVPDPRGPVDRLSECEFTVFHLIGQGKSTQEIAVMLHRSVKTVETYRSRIKRKLGAKNATELAQLAARHLTPESKHVPLETDTSAASYGKESSELPEIVGELLNELHCMKADAATARPRLLELIRLIDETQVRRPALTAAKAGRFSSPPRNRIAPDAGSQARCPSTQNHLSAA